MLTLASPSLIAPIPPDADLTPLAQAVIIQAAREAAAGDMAARAWLLADDTADTWGVLAGLSWPHVRAWVLAGCVPPPGRRG